MSNPLEAKANKQFRLLLQREGVPRKFRDYLGPYPRDPAQDDWRSVAAEVNGSNLYYPAGINPTNFNSTTVPTLLMLTALPFWSARGGVVDQLAVNVVTAAATSICRLGVYDNSPTIVSPNNLLVDTNQDLDCSGTGLKTATTNLPFTFQAATLYWIAFTQSTAAATFTGLSGDNPIYGFNASISAQFGFQKTSVTYGSLPTQFPQPSAGGSPTSASQVCTFVRFSSLKH
jgi:hypothetical protein